MKQKESEVVEIRQVENGYMVHVGSKCEVREVKLNTLNGVSLIT